MILKNQCIGKRQYFSRKTAKNALSRTGSKPINGIRISIYRCPTCPAYHLGHDFTGIAQSVKEAA